MDAHLDELGNHIRRENVVFDHDPESMIRLSHSNTKRVEIRPPTVTIARLYHLVL